MSKFDPKDIAQLSVIIVALCIILLAILVSLLT